MSAATAARGAPAWRAGLVTSTDHKVIARRLMATTIAFFLAGGAMALVMRAELAAPGMQVVSTSSYNTLFTIHGSTMIYLFVTPFAFALGLYIVPLQLGAAKVAGPRVALTGSWLIALGGVAMYAGFLTKGGAAKATWVGFDPLANAVNSPGSGMDLWIAGVFLAVLGSLALAFCLLFTVLRKRAPGMTLLRMPPFCWTLVATVLMTVVSFPVLLVAMALLWAERQFGGVMGDGVSYQNLFWFFGHPVVYVMFFPFLGACFEVLATFSGRRFFGYSAFVASILGFAALSVSVWAHHMFTTSAVSNRFFSLTSTALLVPAGVEYVGAIGTLWGGRIRAKVAFGFALGFFVEFLVGGLSGIWVASPPLDYQANNSYIVVAHLHFVLVGGSLFGIFAALYYWWPKLAGWRLGERLGWVQLALLVVGTNLTFIPQFALGERGMARRVADYPASSGWEGLNLLSTVGAGVIALAIAAFVLNVALSWSARRTTGDDPWEGQTLEWATSSPPPPHNFDGPLPPVRSYAPLWDLRHAGDGESAR